MSENDKAIEIERSADGVGECVPATILVGYVRKINEGRALKLSVNVSAFEDCSTYTVADGQSYVSLTMNAASVSKVLSGERAVTTLGHTMEGDGHEWEHERTKDNVSYFTCTDCGAAKVVEL